MTNSIEINDLFKMANEYKGDLIELRISATIDHDKILSKFITYSTIKNALFTGLEGTHDITGGLRGHTHLNHKEVGLLINFEERQQIFILESSIIKKREDGGRYREIAYEIIDEYSGMMIEIAFSPDSLVDRVIELIESTDDEKGR